MKLVWDKSHDLVSFAWFKKREKRPWRSVTFSSLQLVTKSYLQPVTKPKTKSNTPPLEFFFFRLYKWYEVAQRTTYAESKSTYQIYFEEKDR